MINVRPVPFLFRRAQFYHADLDLRQTKGASSRRRNRSRRPRQTANDIVDEELAADTGRKPDGVEGLSKRPPFPSEGWSTDVASLPRGVSTGVALQHLKSKGKHITTKKPFTRGYNFFFWSYIHTVSCCASASAPAVYYLKSKCWASPKKTESYQQECVLKPSWSMYGLEVMYAHCSCPAGVIGTCHHVVALLLTVEHCVQKDADPPAAESVTTHRRQWGPRPRSVAAQPVMLLQIERASVKRAEGSKEEGRTVACTLYEARGESTLAVSADDLLTLRAESRSDIDMPASHCAVQRPQG